MALQIPCPKCGAELKLRDRSMLGRTGKCPKCGHRFTLAEPDEVRLELAPAVSEEPIRITAARRVSEPISPAETQAPNPLPAEFPTEFPAFSSSAPVPSSVEVLKGARRGPSHRAQIVIGAVIALGAVGLGWIAFDASRRGPKRDTEREVAPTADVSYASERDRRERMAALIAKDSPTNGDPITLRYVPAGASVVIHLHPAALWKEGTTAEETRFCLGDGFMQWADERIRRYCLLSPAEIEEATFCLILGARGSEPQIATVVRPTTPLKRSQLIEMFAARLPNAGESVFIGEDRAFVIGSEEDAEKRPLVFASAPAALAEDLAQAIEAPGITNDAILRTLEKTDRRRHLTIAFRPSELRIHEEALAPQNLRGFWNAALDRFGDDVEAASWSAHFGDEGFYSEFRLRNDPATSPNRLYDELRKSLDALPDDLLSFVSKMNPASIGGRKVVGRLPAMAYVLAASTVGGIGDRFVVLQTRLPERAGPNLALATLLAWDESTRTDFTKPSSGARPSDAATKTLAERLKKPIEVDFRRTPLEEAFAYIGGETGIEFEIDGDALKLAAYTRNMPQTINLGKVPASQAIAELLKPPQDKLAIILDDVGGKAIVTTKAAAEEKGLTPATFTP